MLEDVPGCSGRMLMDAVIGYSSWMLDAASGCSSDPVAAGWIYLQRAGDGGVREIDLGKSSSIAPATTDLR